MAIALQRSVLRSKRTSGRLRSQSATAKGRDRIQVWTLQKSAPRAQHGVMEPGMSALTSDRIRETILFVRGAKTILDANLAALYGVPTKRLGPRGAAASALMMESVMKLSTHLIRLLRLQPRVARRPPEIPRRHRAVRHPALAEHAQRLRRRPRAAAVGVAEALAHAEVVHRQHVEPAEREDEQHLDGPAAHAADWCQALEHLRVP